VIDPMLAAAGASVRIAFESSEIDTIRGLVGAGLGVAIIPERTSTDSGDEVYVPLEPRQSRTLGLAWSTERPLPASVIAFLDHSTAASFASR
jgi:DNA-binding transcriptional LysR family regulator